MEYAFYIYLAILTLLILWVNIGAFSKAKLWTIAIVWFLTPGISALVYDAIGFAILLLYMALFTIAAGVTDLLPDKNVGPFSYDGLKFLILFITALTGGLYLLLKESSPVGYILLFFALITFLVTASDIKSTLNRRETK